MKNFQQFSAQLTATQLTALTTGGSKLAEIATPINGPALPINKATATPVPEVKAHKTPIHSDRAFPLKINIYFTVNDKLKAHFYIIPSRHNRNHLSLFPTRTLLGTFCLFQVKPSVSVCVLVSVLVRVCVNWRRKISFAFWVHFFLYVFFFMLLWLASIQSGNFPVLGMEFFKF
jgi:hypothetical protein